MVMMKNPRIQMSMKNPALGKTTKLYEQVHTWFHSMDYDELYSFILYCQAIL